MMIKFVIVMVVSVVAYGGGTGASVDIVKMELPFKTIEECNEHTEKLKASHSGHGRNVTITCSNAGSF